MSSNFNSMRKHKPGRIPFVPGRKAGPSRKISKDPDAQKTDDKAGLPPINDNNRIAGPSNAGPSTSAAADRNDNMTSSAADRNDNRTPLTAPSDAPVKRVSSIDDIAVRRATAIKETKGDLLPQQQMPPIMLPGHRRKMNLEDRLKARLYSYAPMVAPVNPRALKFKGVTQCQARRLAERPRRIEPLPALRRFQETHQPEFIQKKEMERIRKLRKEKEEEERKHKEQQQAELQDSLESIQTQQEKAFDNANAGPSEAEKFYRSTFPILRYEDVKQNDQEKKEEETGRGRTKIGKIHTEECTPRNERIIKFIPSFAGLDDMDEIVAAVENNAARVPCIYLTAAVPKESVEYHYYNLKCVEFKDVLATDYVTMSHLTATRIRSGMKIEHMPLSQWKKEVVIFRKLHELDTFRLHRKWKAFNVWLKNMRSLRTNLCKKALNENLYILNHRLRDALFTVQRMCLETKEVFLFVIDEKKSYTLETFESTLSENLNQMRKEIDLFRKRVADEGYSACCDCLVKAGFLPTTHVPHEGVGSSISLEKSEEENRYKYTMQANKRVLCQRLTNFVILLDFMVLNTLQYVVAQAVDSLNRYMRHQISLAADVDVLTAQNPEIVENKLPELDLTHEEDVLEEDPASHDKKTGGIGGGGGNKAAGNVGRKDQAKAAGAGQPRRVSTKGIGIGGDAEANKPEETPLPYIPMVRADLVLGKDSVNLKPDHESYVKAIVSMVNAWQLAVINIENLTPDTKFNAVTSPIINNKQEEKTCGDGPNLKSVLKLDERFQEAVEDVSNNLDTIFSLANQYVGTLEKHRIFYNKHMAFDINEFRDPKKPIMGDDPTLLTEALYKLHNEYQMAKAIPDRYPVGSILVEAKELKLQLIPAPVQCLKEIHKSLPDLARKGADDIIAILQKAKSRFEHKGETADDIVNELRFLDDFQVTADGLEMKAIFIKDMYQMMKDFQIATNPEDALVLNSLEPGIYAAKNNIDRALSAREATVEQFIKCADKDIAKYLHDVKDIVDQMQNPMLLDPNADPKEARELLDELLDTMHSIQEKARILKEQQRELKVEVTKFEYLDDSYQDLKLRDTLWRSIDEWTQIVNNWMEVPFETLDPEEVTMTTLKYSKTANTVEKGLPPNKLVDVLRDKVDIMKTKLGVITHMRNPHLKQRHWALIEQALSYKFDPKKEVLNLTLLNEIKAFDKQDQMEEIAGMASSQASLESILKKVTETWKFVELNVMHFKDTKDVFILGNTDDIQQLLDDSHINIQTILSSRHVGPIRPTVEEWECKINLFNKTLEAWNECQRSWLYLETIFSAPDIQRQLPHEAKLFSEVDRSYKEVMRRTYKAPAAMRNGTYAGLVELFQHNNKLLDEIMRCLEAYLESKRVCFPRFYFLSNDELIEILAQTRNPLAVQPHLRKCFDAIHRLEFGILPKDETVSDNDRQEGNSEAVLFSNDILAMISPEGEKIDLTKGLKARGNVEDWLCKVEEAMFASIRKLCKKAMNDFADMQLVPWILANASQVVLTISQMMWTRDVTSILSEKKSAVKGMKEFEKRSIAELNTLATTVRGDLGKLARATFCALITIDVHARDMISEMVRKAVHEVSSFEWQKQLRYYWDTELDNCTVSMSIAVYKYGYEYLGACPRLVITPLTDRCYLCLMGALQLDLGGAPAGPAGTGKTETTKDLAKALAIQCVVFNCSDQLDYTMMGGFFSGLAQSGAWCCFDEFNRINIEVLSVIAQQLITIRNAKAQRLTRFMFEGREIRLVHTCAAFITMNPGYAGRTELPDNLQALFRPISMMVPDYGLIAEVILYSEGFESSKPLAKKMVQMYKLCSEQLSQQDHYDFGMRAVKSVLVMAGSLKRQNPDKPEDVVLIRALRDSNLPKFLSNDALLFQAILGDLFPGVVIPEHDYGKVKEEIIKVQEDMKLQVVESQIVKVIQFYETMIVRHGVMLVGPTGGGKTTIYQILAQTVNNLHAQGFPNEFMEPVHTHVMNPKSITMDELYGGVDKLSMEWKDGIMGITIRHCVNDQSADHHWVICDGPVDALWIENMNTVLDDNKMLCLANSERIKFTPYIHMVFEVQDLTVASPATVSRCGMVYVDAEELKWMPYVKTWMQSMLDRKLFPIGDFCDNLMNLFESYVEDGLQFVQKKCVQAIPQADICKVTTMCKLMEGVFYGPGSRINWSIDHTKITRIVCQTFAFCYLWGVGGNILDNYWDSFDTFIRSQMDDNPNAKLPASAVLWQYYVDVEAKKMDTWDKLVIPFRFDKSVSFSKILVPTEDTTRFGYLLEHLLHVDRPVLYTGGTGVGKSVVARDLLDRISEKQNYIPNIISFSAQTNSKRTQEMIEGKLERRRKNVIGAPRGKRVVFFIDDLNMPKLDTYGSQPPIELIRQYLDFKGLYDRDTMQWKDIQDVSLSAACSPPGGGRNPVTPRLFRHFSMFCIPAPAECTLKHMFTAILKGFFFDFPPNVRSMADLLVSAAVDLYFRMSTDLLPTPAKSHYVFNLRDLSKLVQGVLQADPGCHRDKKVIIKLFIHETQRVFHDRLINKEDKMFFHQIMSDSVAKYTGEFFEPEVFVKTPILFGNFLKIGIPREDKTYDELDNMEKLKHVLGDYLDDFNMGSPKEMNLVFFMDAIEHITRLVRMIQQERGNALLVGVGGCGKQSLTRLAAHVCEYRCFQIELCRGYDYSAFHDDLKKLYDLAGAENKPTVFLFTDTQIVQEEFLEDINNILNSGEVPNLLEPEDVERLIIACRPGAKEVGIPEGNRDAIYDFMISRVRNNLHIVLCMSPVGSAFRSRCRMFPSLVNCCTIDWFVEWPRDALFGVAKQFFKTVDLGCSDEVKESVCKMCVEIHTSVADMAERFYKELKRRYYTTPTSYLELINLYLGMVHDKAHSIKKNSSRIQGGLTKLFQTNALVDNMKKQLLELEPELKQKQQDTTALMEKLKIDHAQADEVKKNVSVDEAIAKKKADETQAIADDAQKDLNEAMPALQAALNALDALDKNDIAEIRVFSKPPELVQTVMEAVAILLGHKTDWASCKAMLGDSQFLKKLADYDKDNIHPAKLVKIKKYIQNPKFEVATVEKVSKACKCMVIWVRAMDTYADVFKTVEPKRAKLAEAETVLEGVMATLKIKQDELHEVEEKIKQLQQVYDKSQSEKKSLERNMSVTAARLKRSSKLTSALADEQVRWEESVRVLDVQMSNVVGDVFVAAACVAYYGAFTSTYREELMEAWLGRLPDLKIPVTPGMTLVSVLADPNDIRIWNADGLPRDPVSTENAILVTKGRRWPLMIDPQEQANRWIRNKEKPNHLKVVKMTDGNFLRIMEACIRTGMPVLMEDVGEVLDPALEPILLKQTFVAGGRLLIRLGDSDIDYDKNFRFYMTSKMSNPHYLPEVCIKVTIINFTVTQKGLEDQILADVVSIERPDLEERKNELITKINSDQTQLKDIESNILYQLSISEGNILDNEDLINILNESKVTSGVIKQRLEEAVTTEEMITTAREKYRSVALRGSVMYFVVSDMGEVDPMYQFSLKYFKNIFNKTIETSEKTEDLDERLKICIEETTLCIYENVARGMFERHKLLFSFMLCAHILRTSGEISALHWNFFLRGPTGGLDKQTTPKPDYCKHLSTHTWKLAVELHETFPNFKSIHTSLKEHPVFVKIGDMQVYANSKDGFYNQSFGPWDQTLSNFEKLMFVKVFHEEKTTFAATEFVSICLGRKFVESPQVALADLYESMSKTTPLVFVLSTGSDPMGAFLRFATERNYLNRVKSISLGQGQGPVAEKMISEASAKGGWVFLQNCHLAASWMLKMENIVKKLQESPRDTHDDFRLFLSSMPVKHFPVSVLQNSVKVTNEPPKGIRANLLRAFMDMKTEFFEKHHLGGDWRKMVFGLCFFHAVILERKKFGPLGWNIKYPFSDTDRDCALLNLEMFCQDKKIPWETLIYITGEITYGGRVTDAQDQRCLRTILKVFFDPKTLDNRYRYSESGIYHSPPYGTEAKFVSYIERLPIIDEPEIFGMHENANIAFQMNETTTFMNTILDVEPRVATAEGGMSDDDIIYEAADDILSRLIDQLDIEESMTSCPAMFALDAKGRMNSLTTVLIQETARFNKLLKVIRRSLEQLKKAIKGFVVMSDELENVYVSFLNNHVPALWANVAYPSLKTLASWVKDLIMRCSFIYDWLRFGLPKSFWLPGFFFPQGFLTGTLQNYARRHNKPIDHLGFKFEVTSHWRNQEEVMHQMKDCKKGETIPLDTHLPALEDGVLVHGLFMEGFAWNADRMQCCDACKGEMYATLPVMQMEPMMDFEPDDSMYSSPLYKTGARAGTLSTTGHSTNYVVAVQLPSSLPQDYWVAKGAALLCSLAD